MLDLRKNVLGYYAIGNLYFNGLALRKPVVVKLKEKRVVVMRNPISLIACVFNENDRLEEMAELSGEYRSRENVLYYRECVPLDDSKRAMEILNTIKTLLPPNPNT